MAISITFLCSCGLHSVLSTLLILIHWIFITTLWDNCYLYMRKMRHKRLDNLPKFIQLVSGRGRLKHRKSNSRCMILNFFEMELWLVMQKDQTVKCLVTPIQPGCLHGSTTAGVSVATCQQLSCSTSRTEGMLNSGQETRVPDTRWIQMGRKLWEKPRKWFQFPFYTNCCNSLLYRRQSTSSLTWPMSLQLHYLIPSLQRLFCMCYLIHALP